MKTLKRIVKTWDGGQINGFPDDAQIVSVKMMGGGPVKTIGCDPTYKIYEYEIIYLTEEG